MPVKKPQRITIHWTAGTNRVSTVDVKHYHAIAAMHPETNKPYIHFGDQNPEANNNTGDGKYAAHTRGFNTGNIGLSIAAMHGATERDMGKHPLTKPLLDAAVAQVAEYLEIYNIPLNEKTVALHSEIQTIHNVRQRGKWDINWMWDEHSNKFVYMEAREAGHRFRNMVRIYQDELAIQDGVQVAARRGTEPHSIAPGLIPAAAHFLKELVAEIRWQLSNS